MISVWNKWVVVISKLEYDKRNNFNIPVSSVVTCCTVDTGSGRRSAGAESDTLSDGLEGISVVLPRLIRETEKDKEAKSTENDAPTRELDTDFLLVVAAHVMDGISWTWENWILPDDI